MGSKQELSCLKLIEQVDLFEHLRASLREGQGSKLCILTEKLSRMEIPYSLGFTLQSGSRKWLRCRISEGYLPDARDRILGLDSLETLPDVGILIVERVL